MRLEPPAWFDAVRCSASVRAASCVVFCGITGTTQLEPPAWFDAVRCSALVCAASCVVFCGITTGTTEWESPGLMQLRFGVHEPALFSVAQGDRHNGSRLVSCNPTIFRPQEVTWITVFKVRVASQLSKQHMVCFCLLLCQFSCCMLLLLF